jgi:hypothetical protein
LAFVALLSEKPKESEKAEIQNGALCCLVSPSCNTNIMSNLSVPSWVLAALVVSGLILYRLYTSNDDAKSSLPLPPGPKGLPVLGMTAQVLAPGKKHATLFSEWEKSMGGSGILLVPTLFRNQVIIRYA